MTLLERIERQNGKVCDFLRRALAHDSDECLIWPFNTNPVNGYGQMVLARRSCHPHRLICEVVKGPPPTPGHLAAHSCHKRNCINPRHLSWKTLSQNMLDRRENGTKNNAWWGNQGKLTADQVRKIRALEGVKTQSAIAALFNITESNVRCIHTRKTWKHVA